MATPPTAAGSPLGARIFGRIRLIVLLVLAALLALCLVFVWLTRDAMSTLAFLRSRQGAAAQTLVDLGPWQTAQTLASLAVTAEEKEFAHQAEHLADHEVDQAFAAALRQADLQTRRRSLTGQALTLSQRVAQLQQEITQDRATVDQLKAQKNADPNALQVAQAQLDLDSDELTDAQQDLQRATGDQSVRIQQELAAHEASMRKYDAQQQNPGQAAIVSVQRHTTLAGRIKAWFDQRSRRDSIQQARTEAQDDVRSITAEHNAIETRLNAPASGAAPSSLTQLQNRRTERQILAIDDDRIQTDQQLAEIYSKWSDQVQLQHRILLHLILQSFALILAIVVFMMVGDALVRRLFEQPRFDLRQTQILRTIVQVGVQVLGVVLIALVLFGPPQQTATMVGLATAALTICLQDYVLAFLGWFMLVGKNGIRVGDIVEINGVSGEVIEIGLMSTTLLEVNSLAAQGELTGRRVSFLNSFAIRGQYFNFSSRGQWLWDEMTVTVPAGRDFQTLAAAVEKIIREETEEKARQAEYEWNSNMRAAGLNRFNVAPALTLRPSGAGIEIQVRYVTNAKDRLAVRDRLYRKIIQLLEDKQLPATAPQPTVVTGPRP
jgi:small-conductance mechanosensitive channel